MSLSGRERLTLLLLLPPQIAIEISATDDLMGAVWTVRVEERRWKRIVYKEKSRVTAARRIGLWIDQPLDRVERQLSCIS